MKDFIEEGARLMRVKKDKLEEQMESWGIIAYAVSETKIIFYAFDGQALELEGFFYPEGGFLNINGQHILTLLS